MNYSDYLNSIKTNIWSDPEDLEELEQLLNARKGGKKCRLIYRKSDNKFCEVQTPHLVQGEYVYLPINNNFYFIESTR